MALVAPPVASSMDRLPAVGPMSDADRSAKPYAHLIGAAKQHLGLKGFVYHLKVEKAVTLSERRALIEPLGEAIAKAKGMAAAKEFLEISREFSGA